MKEVKGSETPNRCYVCRDRIVEVYQDDNPPNPRKDWDHLGILVGCTRAIENDAAAGNLGAMSDVVKEIREQYGVKSVIFGLRNNGDSGLSIVEATGARPFSGFIFIPESVVTSEYGALIDHNVDKAMRCLQAEIETYNQYVTGDIWGYVCRLDSGEEIDSCWGFFGHDDLSSGLLEHALGSKDAEEAVLCEIPKLKVQQSLVYENWPPKEIK